MAARSTSSRCGIHSAVFADSRHHAAASAGGVRARLSSIHYSRRRARSTTTRSDREKNRHPRLLSPTAASLTALPSSPTPIPSLPPPPPSHTQTLTPPYLTH